jgi:nucleotidyltransferase/DNA polymerase involved in DNA repair
VPDPEVLRARRPEVEPLSLDEAFIDVTASQRLFGTPLAIGRLLRERVRAATDLAVSVGIGPGKMIAKLASDASKPDGLLKVEAHEVRAFLDPLPVGRLWGIGPVTRAVLERAGIRTIADLVAVDLARLRRVAGPATEHLRALARGDDPRAVESDRDAKSYGERARSARTCVTTRSRARPSSCTPRRSRAGCVTTAGPGASSSKMKLAERLGRAFRLLTTHDARGADQRRQ